MRTAADGSGRWRRAAVIAACLLLLCWPALANRQPFFFPDTTSYVRAADMALKLASGGRLTGGWAERYEAKTAAEKPPAAGPAAAAPRPARGNDLDNGVIMAGRSPYFGAVLLLADLASGFWLFVLLNAVVSLVLIRLFLRAFALDRDRWLLAATALLSLGSTFAFYGSYLLADVYAGQGVLALLLIAVDRRARSGWEWTFLLGVIALAAVSHFTHVAIFAALTGLFLLLVGLRALPWPGARAAVLAGAGATVVGMLSITLTSAVVAAVFGKPPQLVPLLTARFIADGPGHDYLRETCPASGFAACRYADRPRIDAANWLWSTDPARGVYPFADPATRFRLSAEDGRFALAVLAHDPVGQTGAALRNTALQAVWIDSGWLNYAPEFTEQLARDIPPAHGRRVLETPSARGVWPAAALTFVHAAVAVAALALLIWEALRRGPRNGAERDALLFAGLVLAALLVNAFLGGALSEPQNRYQGRIIWLLPLAAVPALARLLRARRSSSRAGANLRPAE